MMMKDVQRIVTELGWLTYAPNYALPQLTMSSTPAIATSSP